MIRDTSFVTNIDVKKTPKIRKSERAVIVFSFEASPTTGLKTFSFLKPSKTQSIISSIPRVCQSIFDMSSLSGGVINKEMTAASTASVSISSFLRKLSIFFMGKLYYNF